MSERAWSSHARSNIRHDAAAAAARAVARLSECSIISLHVTAGSESDTSRVLLTEEPQFGRVKQMPVNCNSTGLHGNARSNLQHQGRQQGALPGESRRQPAGQEQGLLDSEARPPEANLTGRLPAVAPARAAAALCLRMSAASGPCGRAEASCVFYLTGSSLGDPQSSIPAYPDRAAPGLPGS